MTVDRRDWLYEEREIASLRAALAEERRVRRLLAEALNGWLTTDLPIPLRLLQETSRALAESGALDQETGEA